MNAIEERPTAESIFTSRDDFDPRKYIARLALEGKYRRALNMRKCVLVRGNSGTGKTWLTYQVLKSNKYDYDIINLSKVIPYGNFNDYFKAKLGEVCDTYSVSKETGGDIGVASAGLQTERSFTVGHDYYIEYLKKINKRKDKQFIVFDNFETLITHSELIEELSRLIILIDDPEVMEYKTYPIIIGANSDILHFFKKTPNISTIDNRIFELEEIKGFTLDWIFRLESAPVPEILSM